jgi:uncharacterized membrane protein
MILFHISVRLCLFWFSWFQWLKANENSHNLITFHILLIFLLLMKLLQTFSSYIIRCAVTEACMNCTSFISVNQYLTSNFHWCCSYGLSKCVRSSAYVHTFILSSDMSHIQSNKTKVMGSCDTRAYENNQNKFNVYICLLFSTSPFRYDENPLNRQTER